jgi:hypothetical protein
VLCKGRDQELFLTASNFHHNWLVRLSCQGDFQAIVVITDVLCLAAVVFILAVLAVLPQVHGLVLLLVHLIIVFISFLGPLLLFTRVLSLFECSILRCCSHSDFNSVLSIILLNFSMFNREVYRCLADVDFES